MRAYVAFNSFLELMGVTFIAVIFGILTRFAFGRKLLLDHPKFFTFGFVSNEGPTEEANENVCFEMIFRGEGWKETLPEPTDEFATPINKKIITKVSAVNPGI